MFLLLNGACVREFVAQIETLRRLIALLPILIAFVVTLKAAVGRVAHLRDRIAKLLVRVVVAVDNTVASIYLELILSIKNRFYA